MKSKPLPSQEILASLLIYDAKTGLLFWRERPRSMFKRDKDWTRWNGQYAGLEALSADTGTWHKKGTIFSIRYKAHRIVWKLIKGTDPLFIDHINGDPADNRIENLRSVSHRENHLNQKLHNTNTSGTSGVYWFKPQQKWMAKINTGVGTDFLGYFAKKEDAIAARKQAERRLGYHENHATRKSA